MPLGIFSGPRLFHFICKRPKVFLSLELHIQSRNIYQTFLLHTQIMFNLQIVPVIQAKIPSQCPLVNPTAAALPPFSSPAPPVTNVAKSCSNRVLFTFNCFLRSYYLHTDLLFYNFSVACTNSLYSANKFGRSRKLICLSSSTV